MQGVPVPFPPTACHFHTRRAHMPPLCLLLQRADVESPSITGGDTLHLIIVREGPSRVAEPLLEIPVRDALTYRRQQSACGALVWKRFGRLRGVAARGGLHPHASSQGLFRVRRSFSMSPS